MPMKQVPDIVIDNTGLCLPTGAGSTWTAYAAGHQGVLSRTDSNGVRNR